MLIAAELILIAAELNVVLARRLWPRSLTGELLEADKQALRHLAQTAQLERLPAAKLGVVIVSPHS